MSQVAGTQDCLMLMGTLCKGSICLISGFHGLFKDATAYRIHGLVEGLDTFNAVLDDLPEKQA